MFDFLNDEFVYRLAPDGKSVKAASDLVRGGAFLTPEADGRRLRARCQGSVPRPYAVEVDLSEPEAPGASCNCDSYKQPCKHALGLLLLAARSPESFAGWKPSEAGRAAVAAQPAGAKARPPADLREALEQAILAEPEDVTPRLVYADWLEEYGPAEEAPRAEFIRVQVQLAGLAEAAPREKALRRREGSLWRAHKAKWLAHLPAHLRTKRDVRFHRGFLEELALPPRSWAKHGEKLFGQNPIYRLRLRGLVDRHAAGELVVIPELVRIRELVLEGCSVGQPLTTLQILFATPFWSGLRRLRMAGCGLSTRDLGVLVDSPVLGRLAELDLANDNVGPSGVEALAGSPAAAGLRRLSLACNPVGDAGGKALAASAPLASLERLDLSGVELGERVRASLRERFGARLTL